MSKILQKIWNDESGQDIAEYAVMLAVILVIVVGTIRLIGTHVWLIDEEFRQQRFLQRRQLAPVIRQLAVELWVRRWRAIFLPTGAFRYIVA